jgi:hypothetical protein
MRNRREILVLPGPELHIPDHLWPWFALARSQSHSPREAQPFLRGFLPAPEFHARHDLAHEPVLARSRAGKILNPL